MAQTLVLVHTVPPLIADFTRLAAELLPGVRLLHLLDEPLLERIKRRGATDEDVERLAGHVAEAVSVGGDVVLVTCSTVSPLVERVPLSPIPVLTIDGPLVAEALRLGTRIGVIATNATTLEPTQQMLAREAARAGRTIELRPVLVEGALAALLAGNGATHDELVAQAIRALAPQVDLVLLAQASTARVAALFPPGSLPVPLLSSPAPALRRVAQLLAVQEGMHA